MKDLTTIRTDFNRSVAGSYDKNQQVLEDIRFAKLPGAQWSGNDLEQFQNKPRPENNKIARQINRILGQYERLEMNAKIVSNSEEATDDDAELLQSRWRNDFNMSDGIEALNNAADEAFHGGFGAYKVIAKYEDDELEDDDYQNLAIEPVYSAASSVVYNAGALRKDKRDATQAWQLIRVNRHETEERFGTTIAPYPEASANYDYFDWFLDNKKDVYIAHYYEVVKKRITTYKFDNIEITKDGRKLTDQMGNKIDRDLFNEMKETMFFEEETRSTQYVEYALLSGDQYLIKPRRTPFKTVPIIPQYGYHTILNGVEFYCGEVARQRDNQRFLNMGFGALMEIMAQPQTETPEYAPEQVQRFATMHANRTVDNYAYTMSDPIKNKNGDILQSGPVHVHQPPQIGSGLATSLQFLEGNLNEQGGTGQSTLPSNVSAAAVNQINERQDDSYQPLFQNAMQSLKAACEVWIPAAKELYFTNSRTIRLEGPDGSYSQIKTVQYMQDNNTGEYGPFKNAARGKYDVVIKTGESHKSKKEADRQANLEILQFADTNSPIGQLTLNNLIMTTTGEDTADARRIARFNNLKIMLDMGIDPQPKTEEEQQYVVQLIQAKQAAMQQGQQDPNMIAAIAQDKLATAELIDKQVDQFNAETKRMEAVVKAEKAGADINKINADIAKTGQEIESSQIDNTKKVVDMYRGA